MVIEDILMRHRGIDHVTASGVHHPLGFASGTGGVKDEERVFGIHFFSRAISVSFGHPFMIPVVPAFDPVDRVAGTADNDTGRAHGAGFERRIGVGLERNDLAATNALIGGDDGRAVTILNASGQCVG